jgi:Integrase zinc binding domain
MEAQSRDLNISFIAGLISADGQKANWDWMQPKSKEVKALWHQWDRLAMIGGLLVRMFEEADGTVSWPQIIMLKEMRAEFLRDIHAGVGGGHLGRHRTELAVRARAYWPGWHDDICRALRTCS